ncbi:MAG: NAD(P)-dependent oxidoreductase [Microcystis sp. M54BS1]|jgi:nucleoside-diphosphate-sugar epimerase|uniref:UDP-glucose 4-epimerase n=1 Tax=Microcystis aeruginosa (strain NIES-843 / IAM M-2473) TaxID=449447 RepID=B0JS15_MICAN|nr:MULTISPECIES: NAD(P)-dependent oxidoreductase [Microcystis]MCA2538494.1 NAD(P)-dependent oxidoreductase [Microcystis sp. M54BS1]MCA2598393.1 NAD(P)-dependent oxidoreductase [Microcystis sp. M38BS1]MCA2608959.1 NAD(P)-dependent oxidoreductase [Microcystis sp. M27BS1]MCA2505310.1 NAD(P)-dependent oxidoreductase [Microcystis sp. M62BS1]MCA2509310.1 NAD(P)-dependent oxidoreductase [Microcystis sp. M60BS1]
MKVLITGASGFVGSHVARLLVAEGCEVHVLVRESSNRWRIQDILPSMYLWQSDLVAFENVNTYLQEIKPELCIHLAWYAVPGKYLNSQENLDSIQASINLLSQLAELGCKRFVGIGTCFEYDLSLGYLSESSLTKPITLYAATKVALSTILQQFAQITEMEVAWIRLFYQYGPMEDERRLIPGIISSLLRDEVVKTTKGEQIRDFLHIEDVASAIWAVAKSNVSGVVNVGSGQPVTVGQIALELGNLLGKPDLIHLGALPYRPNDPMFICANNELLRKKTDWTQKYNLTTGLKNTIKWYKDHLNINKIEEI